MPTRSGKGWCTWHAVSRISSNHGSHTRVRTAHTHYITCLFVLPCSFFLLKGIKTFANLKERSAKRLTVPQSQWWHPIIRKRHGSRLFCSITLQHRAEREFFYFLWQRQDSSCCVCTSAILIQWNFRLLRQSVCCREYETTSNTLQEPLFWKNCAKISKNLSSQLCVIGLFTTHVFHSPCNFWFSRSILCSRICCRMAFLHSSRNSSLLFRLLSSGTTPT